MRTRNNKLRKIAWGIFLVGAAALIIVNAYFSITTFFPLLLGILMIPLIVDSIVRMNFFGVFFPAALLGIVFSKQLGLEAITPWPILAAALLLTIGFYALFHKRNRTMSYVKNDYSDTVEDILDDEMSCNVKFGSSSKFIHTDNFERANIDCSFGSIKMYFDNARLSANGAVISIVSNFSGVELFIPKHWRIQNNVLYILGGLEEKYKNIPEADSPLLVINGEVRFSGLVIYYI